MTTREDKDLRVMGNFLRTLAGGGFGRRSRRDSASRRQKNRLALRVEGLESRQLLALPSVTTIASFNNIGPNNIDLGQMYPSELVMDTVGDIFGTTRLGGNVSGLYPDGAGTIFEIPASSLAAGKNPTIEILAKFNANGSNGATPMAGLIFNSAGDLFGTTSDGGAFATPSVQYGYGTVFEIDPKSAKPSIITVASFNDTDGAFPVDALTLGRAANCSARPLGAALTTTARYSR